jgi:AAA domain
MTDDYHKWIDDNGIYIPPSKRPPGWDGQVGIFPQVGLVGETGRDETPWWQDQDEPTVWTPSPLSTVGDFTAERITSDAALPLYAGLLTALVGAGESGKSFLALHAALDVCLYGTGSVLVLDGEMSAPAVRSRLLELGATEADLGRIYYDEIGAVAYGGDVNAQQVIDACDALDVRLVIIDSAGSLLSRTTKSEIDNVEVTRVYDQLRRIVTDSRRSLALVDHTAKAATSVTPRGATAKFNALDMAYGVTLAAGSVPGTEKDWSALVTVEKDRHGLLASRCDRVALFHPLGARTLAIDVSTSMNQSHRLTMSAFDRALAEIRALDPPPTSGNDVCRRIVGTRRIVLDAYKAWREA